MWAVVAHVVNEVPDLSRDERILGRRREHPQEVGLIRILIEP